jgi:hypothetical protein
MASKKDMRRVDLVIPYVEPPAEKDSDFSSTFSSTMPMAAVCSNLQALLYYPNTFQMFMRNKMLGWVSLLVSLLNWLSETPSQKSTSSTPAYLSFAMATLAVGTVRINMALSLCAGPHSSGRHISRFSFLPHQTRNSAIQAQGRKRLPRYLEPESKIRDVSTYGR